jgi:hypothetical protein
VSPPLRREFMLGFGKRRQPGYGQIVVRVKPFRTYKEFFADLKKFLAPFLTSKEEKEIKTFYEGLESTGSWLGVFVDESTYRAVQNGKIRPKSFLVEPHHNIESTCHCSRVWKGCCGSPILPKGLVSAIDSYGDNFDPKHWSEELKNYFLNFHA